MLVPCANAAIKDKKKTYFKYKYERIKKRCGHKWAVIAIALMMQTYLYHMFLKQESFNPADTDYSDISEEMQKFQEQYDKNAIKCLEKSSFTVISISTSA